MVFGIALIALSLAVLFVRDVKRAARIKKLDNQLKTYLEHEQEKGKEREKEADQNH